MRYTKEQMKAQYQTLPDEVKNFMASEETIDNILDIGRKYNLHMDQLNALSEEIGIILHGLERPEAFHNNLLRYVGVSEDIANLMTYDLNSEIFSKIRAELQKAPTPKQIFEQKMGGIANVPKQEVEVKAQTGDNDSKGATNKAPRDPYREPID